jgi:MFS family permease
MRANSWVSIVGIYLFGVCGGSTVSKIVPLAADMGGEFGLSPSAFGWLVAMVAIPAAIFAIPSGVVVDRVGPKRVLVAAALLGMVANAVYLMAPSLGMIRAARLMEGLAIVHIYTAGPAMLMATTTGDRRTRAMTLWSTYAPVGTAIGLAIGGLYSETANWPNVFVMHMAMFAAAGLLGLFQADVRIAQRGELRALRERLSEFGSAFARAPLILLGAAFFLIISMGLGINVTLPSYLAGVHGISVHAASNIVASVTLTMIVGSFVVGLLLPRGASMAMTFVMIAIASFCFGSLSFYPDLSLTLRWIVTTGWFISSGAALATTLAALPLVAERHRLGAAASLINFAGALAVLVNPPLWLGIAASGEWQWFILLLATGFCLAAILLLGATRVAGVAARAEA